MPPLLRKLQSCENLPAFSYLHHANQSMFTPVKWVWQNTLIWLARVAPHVTGTTWNGPIKRNVDFVYASDFSHDIFFEIWKCVWRESTRPSIEYWSPSGALNLRDFIYLHAELFLAMYNAKISKKPGKLPCTISRLVSHFFSYGESRSSSNEIFEFSPFLGHGRYKIDSQEN